ncbi:hypothetical protein [Pseudotabrizicola sediminis]|uniref:hypothetical protein n=1 Tax=Pseudotabrizicola sediminis TaxID=2486418 RepID=UPI0010814367|nr:hypothetical protein [Pseudotabrizicola sediminis]
MTLKALMSPVKGALGYSLEDARQLYLKERIGVGEDPRRHAARNRLAKLFVRAEAGGLPASTLLVDLTRQQARDVRDHMLTYEKPGGGKVAPASVKRDLTIMKAMIGHAIREFDLIKAAHNPFEALEVGISSGGEEDIAARELKETLPDAVIAAMRGNLQGELNLIWGLGSRHARLSH